MSRVLVADDEPAIRKVVRDAFEREGHEVVAAIDGQEALERFEEGGFDLVVTDLAMPGSAAWSSSRRSAGGSPRHRSWS